MSTPQKCETPLAGGVVAEQSSIEASIVAYDTPEDKQISTLKAKAALLGHQVFELAEGGFAVTRWGWVRTCPDAAALASFLAQIGGRL